jgi:hypothetical protein
MPCWGRDRGPGRGSPAGARGRYLSAPGRGTRAGSLWRVARVSRRQPQDGLASSAKDCRAECGDGDEGCGRGAVGEVKKGSRL